MAEISDEHLEPVPSTDHRTTADLDRDDAIETPAHILERIHSWQDFATRAQSFISEEGDDSFFAYTKFIFVDEDNSVYFGKLPYPEDEISLNQAKHCLRKIPPCEVYPPMPADFPIYQAHTNNRFQTVDIIRPMFTLYPGLSGTTELASRLFEEAKVLQLLRQNPHQNLPQFRGCVVKDGLIAGLATRKYRMTLQSALKYRERYDIVTKTAFLMCLRAAVEHLHSLGLAHNYINTDNVMINDQNQPVLVGLKLCKPLGSPLTGEGPHVVFVGRVDVSSKENDEYGLETIREWLEI